MGTLVQTFGCCSLYLKQATHFFQNQISPAWCNVAKCAVSEAVLSLTKLTDCEREPDSCLSNSIMWRALAALCVLDRDHVDKLSSAESCQKKNQVGTKFVFDRFSHIQRLKTYEQTGTIRRGVFSAVYCECMLRLRLKVEMISSVKRSHECSGLADENSTSISCIHRQLTAAPKPLFCDRQRTPRGIINYWVCI